MARKKTEPVEDKPDVYRVSQSKVKTYRKCHHAYHLKYVEKLRRKRKPRALMFGTLIHQMIEADANGNDPFEVLEAINLKDAKLFAAEREEYGEIIEDVGSIMGEYFDHWEREGSMRYLEIDGRSAEHQFEIEILPGVIWNGKIDALGEANKLRWLVEHKTFKRKPTDDDRWRNLQSVSYFRAMDILGWPSVDGTCWDYVWSKPPLRPQLLASGKLSQKKMDTLPSTVRSAIKSYGLNPRDYRDYIKSTEENRKQWFSRIYTPVSEAVKEEVFTDFINTVDEMAERHGKVSDRNIERHCTWCDFEPLCRARLQGLDYEYVKERQYETSTGRPDEDPDGIHFVAHEDIDN